MRARYGAGGIFARGSLAAKRDDKQSRNNDIQFAARQDRSSNMTSDNNAQSSNKSSISQQGSNSNNSDISNGRVNFPVPPRQSYAKELLAQCRECRAELEKERDIAERGGSGSSWTSWVPFIKSDVKDEVPGDLGSTQKIKEKLSTLVEKIKSPTPSSDNIPSSYIPSSVSSLFSSSSSKSDSSEEVKEPHSDHEGEAGWIGSGVWGLSAVGQKQRQADRDRDDRVAGGHEVEDDGGKRQRQIEWEGFLRYADQKERGENGRVGKMTH